MSTCHKYLVFSSMPWKNLVQLCNGEQSDLRNLKLDLQFAYEDFGPFWMEFICSSCACASFLRVLRFPPTGQCKLGQLAT